MSKNTIISWIVMAMLFVANITSAQVSGTVTDLKGEPIVGANLLWLNTGIGAVTDLDGNFTIKEHEVVNQLIVRYIGFETDTITIDDPTIPLQIVMRETTIQLNGVEVTGRAAATVKSRLDAVQSQKISGEELCKAACCNLSESFETNASVDVAFADAATGAKTIRMLGLSGTYVQMLSENTPGVRGLAANYGMEYIPGPWMESIQVSKGTSSVINGYEATTGQINIEYLKPQTADPIAINGLINSNLGVDVNVTGGWDLNKNVSTAVLAYYKNSSMEHDSNGDKFLDLPTTQQVNALNRWYIKKGEYTGQVLFRGLYDTRHGGQSKAVTGDRYGIDINTTRFDGFIKNGYVFDQEKGTSIGIILAGSYHRHNSLYGHTDYDAKQANAYLNAIFQTNFTDHHKISTGLSFNFDHYNEALLDPHRSINRNDFSRSEITPGVFAEYSYTYHDKLSLIAGIRADYSNRYGVFFTPRFNIRYAPWEWWNLRASVGMGYRSPNVVSDNSLMLPTQRNIVFEADRFEQERAINTGISTTFYIPVGAKEIQLSADYYYTHFLECVIVDLDRDATNIYFDNLNGGRSYAGNLQVEAEMEILRGWTMTLAYRWSDVKQTTNGKLVEKPLTNRFKALITTSYQTKLKKWQFDFTAQFNGGGRMPSSFTPYADSHGDERSTQYIERTDGNGYDFKWYPQLMAQVTRYFKHWSIYIGGENLTNFKQKNPVLNAETPYDNNFDASMAWGPIHGAKAYIGFRWNIDRK